MKDYRMNWSPSELKTYILLFFINSDYTNEGLGLDQLHSNTLEFNKIRQEFNRDNDYQSIQKICAVVKTENYSRTQLHILLNDVKNWFAQAEKKQSHLLSNRLTTLERILVKAA